MSNFDAAMTTTFSYNDALAEKMPFESVAPEVQNAKQYSEKSDMYVKKCNETSTVKRYNIFIINTLRFVFL